MKAAPHFWFRSVVAYTLAGCVSACLAGTILGLIGYLIGRLSTGALAVWLVVPIALILAARELEWVSFCLPERRRQTVQGWVHEFGVVMASGMWGFNLGFGFATYITYGGFVALVAMAVAVGDPAYGAVLMVAYWLGRTMSVWLAPVIWLTQDTDELIDAIIANETVFRTASAFGLLWFAGVAMLFGLRAGSFLSGSVIEGHLP